MKRPKTIKQEKGVDIKEGTFFFFLKKGKKKEIFFKVLLHELLNIFNKAQVSFTLGHDVLQNVDCGLNEFCQKNWRGTLCKKLDKKSILSSRWRYHHSWKQKLKTPTDTAFNWFVTISWMFLTVPKWQPRSWVLTFENRK